MSDLPVVLRSSRVWHDRSGECWLLLHVPSEVDVGEIGNVLWDRYCRFLEEAYADISGSDALKDSEIVFSGVLK